MTVQRQIEIMEAQLACFDTLLEKLQYLTNFFDPDPEFSKEARDIVRSNLAKKLQNTENQ